MANSIGVGGLPEFIVIQPYSMLNFFIAMGVAIVVSIVVVFILAKRAAKKENV